MSHWYLVHTKSAQEVSAQRNLQRQAYEVYLPRISQPVLRKGAWSECVCPLFPRYLFLHVGETQSVGPVRSSVGVVGIVRFGFRYGIVPESVIAELMARTNPVSGLLSLASPRHLRRGAPVRVTQGVFSGLEGILQREDGAERVVVLLNLLGTNAQVQIPARYLSSGRAA